MHIPHPSRTQGRAILLEHLVFALGNFVACLIGLLARDPLSGVICFWPAAGTALFAATRLGWRVLPALIVSQLGASLLVQPYSTPMVFLGVGGPVLAWAGAFLWRRLSNLTSAENPVQRNVGIFMVVGLVVGFMAGGLGTTAGALEQDAGFWLHWSEWVAANTLGICVVTPVLMRVPTIRARFHNHRWRRKLIVVSAAVVLGCTLLYTGTAPALSIGFIIGPLLGWSAIRLRLDGTVVLGLIATAATMPFISMHTADHMLLISVLLSVCVASSMLTAGLAEDHHNYYHLREKIVERLETAHGALQRQENQMRSLFDHLPDAIVLIDNNTLYYANEAADVLHTALFPDEPQASRWIGLLSAVTNSSDEISVITGPGQVSSLEIRCSPFAWSGHSGRLCTLRDLTSVRRTEQELQVSQLRFERIFQLSPNPIMIVAQTDGRVVAINDSWERLFGLRREETVNRPITELGIWVNLARRADLLADVSRQGEVRSREQQMRHRDGHPLAVEFSSRIITIDGADYLLSILTDITERKNAEVALRTSEERHRLLIENMHDLVAEIDDQGICRYASPNIEQTLGFAPAAVVGKAIIEIVHPDDRPAVLLHQKQSSETSLRIRMNTADGDWRLMACSYKNLRTPEGRLHSIVNAHDITTHVKEQEDRLNLERQLRQAQKLEAIGSLAGGIAHDFNNVLTVILGNAELATLDISREHPLAPYLQNILDSSRRARDLVAQILTFSRRREQQLTPCGITSIIKETAKLLRSTVPANIEIGTELPERDEPVRCDPSQIHQVVMNLCTNAVHAMRPAGGSLKISLASVEVDHDMAGTVAQLHEGKYQRLTIRDTGCGMSETVLNRIFEPFFTTKAPGEGTGLGLAVVHGIVESHKGAISVHSREGQGTVFTIYLPCASEAEASPKAPRRQLRGQGETILVIDDEHAITDMLFKMLGRLGYEPVCHNDPVRAISVYAKSPQRFAAVLCDLSMPKISGLQVAEHLSKHKTSRLLLMSGFMRPEEADEARRLGVAGMIDKPLDSATVSEELARVLHLPNTPPSN